MSSSHERPVRVATWPPRSAAHPYIEPCYDALAAHAIDHIRDLPADANALSRRAEAIDVWHLHWPDTYWRGKGTAPGRQAVRVARLLGLIARARRAGVRVVWTVDESAQDAETGAVDRVGFRSLHRAVDLRIFTSAAARTVAAQRHRVDTPALVVPLGGYPALPDAAPRADIRRALGVPPACRVLLFDADLRHSTGVDVALEALRLLPRGAYRLLIAGRMIPPHGERLAAATTSQPGVHLVASRIDDQHRRDLLCASDAVILPHRVVTESSALMDALSNGRAVVVTDLPYFREVLGDSREGCAFTRHADGVQLAQAIMRVFEVPADRRERAARGVAAGLRWERVVAPYAKWLRAPLQPIRSGPAVSEGARPPTASAR